MWLGVGCPCQPVRNDIVTPRHLFSLNLTLISYLSRRKSSNKNEKKPKNGKEEAEKEDDEEEENFSFLESVWYFSLVGIQMGMDQHPKSLSGRILIFV